MQRLHRIVVLGALHVSIWCSLTVIMADLSPWLIGFDPHRDFRVRPAPSGSTGSESVDVGAQFVETLAKTSYTAFLDLARPLAAFWLLFSVVYYGWKIRGERVRGELSSLARFASSLAILALGVASLFQLASAAVSYLHHRLGTWRESFVLPTQEQEPLFFLLNAVVPSAVLALAAWGLWWETLRGARAGKGVFGQNENLSLAVEVLTVLVFLGGLWLLYSCGLVGFGLYASFAEAVAPFPGTEEFPAHVRGRGSEFAVVLGATAFFLVAVLSAVGFGLKLLGSGFNSNTRTQGFDHGR